jgi:CofD-related protein of GAK system
MRIRVRRSIALPDEIRVARSRRAPELGARVLFLSGGSALRALSRTIKQYTHNTIHLVTPFDSGGSSARLRETFGMLSVGDLRSRLIALADESIQGNPEIYRLFTYRFPSQESHSELAKRLQDMIEGVDPLVEVVPDPLRLIARTQLRLFGERMPSDFDLRGASLGNLILTGAYLSSSRDIDSVLFLVSKLVEVRGTVRPVVDANLQLAARLEGGEWVVGQHLITGKETQPPISPIADCQLVRSADDRRPAAIAIPGEVRKLIRGADLICYPMGSFYSSVISNMLPRGVGQAIASSGCPKVYIPNTGHDPEQLGMSIGRAAETILGYLRRDAGADCRADDLLNFLLVDTKNASYSNPRDLERLEASGVQVIDMDLVSPRSRPALDPERLTHVLLSLAS